MADHLEIRHERLYVRVPGADKLRRTASGRVKHLLNAGWRETDRTAGADYVQVRLERTGFRPPMMRIPAPAPMQARPRRDGGSRDGGPRGRGPGGASGGRPLQGRGPQSRPSQAPQEGSPPQQPPAASPAPG